MRLKNKVGPITAIAITGITVIWMYAGGNGITTAQADVASPPSNSGMENSEAPKITSVQAQTLTAEFITNTLNLSGQTAFNTSLTLINQLQGQVTQVNASKGDYVKKGDIILEIDHRTLDAQILQARAVIKQRTLELDGVKRLSGQQLTSQVSVAEAEAALSTAKANLAALEVDLEHAQIRAPFSGILNNFSIKTGQQVSVGDDLGTLLDVSPLIVEVNVPQIYLGQVPVGTFARVTLDNGETVESVVRYSSAQADAATRTLPVELEVQNEDYSIPAGISAHISFELSETKAHSLSPALLSVDDQGDMSVKTLNVDNQVVENKVTIIRSDRDKVWVTGLPNNVNVITVGQGFVSVGDTVEAHYQR